MDGVGVVGIPVDGGVEGPVDGRAVSDPVLGSCGEPDGVLA